MIRAASDGCFHYARKEAIPTICIYDKSATDFSGNGLGLLSPTSCEVTETLNGQYEVVMEHPLDDAGKWQRIEVGRILRVPVPSTTTPQVALVHQDEYRIYKTNAKNRPIRASASTSGKVLKKYAKNKEVIQISAVSSSWYEVTGPDGKHGYMQASHLSYVRTAHSETEATGEVVEARQLRDQPFRIYRVVPDLNQIVVYARHIFFDLLDNMIKSYKPAADVAGSAVLQGIAEACLSDHPFGFFSDIEATAEDMEFVNINPIEAITGDEMFIAKYGGELLRDWFDVFVVGRVGRDTSIRIREGHDLTSVSYDEDDTDVVTRIMPVGEDKDGNILYLPETYVDSDHFDDYPHARWSCLEVSDAKEVKKGEDKKTKAQCYEAMRAAAQAEFDNGCDRPKVTVTVDFVNLAETAEYKNYAVLQNIYLGDAVYVITKRSGITAYLRMTEYTYDCLTGKYTGITLGAVTDSVDTSMISARQIASGSIGGSKLAPNSVGTGQLQSGAVGNLQIRNAAISNANIQDATIAYAKIADAAISALKADALEAVVAKIGTLTADNITTDTLGAQIIRAAQLSAQKGEFDEASITHLVSNVFNLDGNGTMDDVYIHNLAVGYAQMVGATLGSLVLKGADGEYYRINVGDGGALTAEDVTDSLTAEEIAAGQTSSTSELGPRSIIETTLTVDDMSASNIKGEVGVINKIYAALVDTDVLLAREAFITKLYTSMIFGGKSLQMLVGTDDNIRSWFDFGPDGMVVSVPDGAWQTVTNASGYHIRNTETGKTVGSFRSDGLAAEGIVIGDIRAKRTSSGGWVWTDA